MTEFAIFIEEAGSNFVACAPDVPGRITAGSTSVT